MEQGDFKITERRCKICMSTHRDAIDLMLLGESHREDGSQYRYSDMVDWAAVRGLQVTEPGLSRHRNNHLQPSVMAALETQKYMEAISKATGKKLSLPRAFANVVLNKMLRYVNELGEDSLDGINPDRLLRTGLNAARAAMAIERAEELLTREQVAETVSEGLKRKGLTQETIQLIEREILGME